MIGEQWPPRTEAEEQAELEAELAALEEAEAVAAARAARKAAQPKRKAWTEQQYAERGWKTIKARVRGPVADTLDRLASELGASKADVLTALILAATEKSGTR